MTVESEMQYYCEEKCRLEEPSSSSTIDAACSTNDITQSLKTLVLESSDGVQMECDGWIARNSTTLADMIGYLPELVGPTPLLRVHSQQLKALQEWSSRCAKAAPTPVVLTDWQRLFLHRLEEADTLFPFINAALFLGMDKVLRSATVYLSEMLSSMDVNTKDREKMLQYLKYSDRETETTSSPKSTSHKKKTTKR